MEKFSSKIFNVTQLKNEVIRLAEKNGFTESCYSAMLDYTINNLQSSGLGEKYYGYHNIDHLLEIPLGTAYPWSGKLKENGKKSIQKCFNCSKITKNNPKKQEHYLWLGWLLSVIDRMTSYALGNFSKAMHVAKMNSHALGWHPDVLVQRSVSYSK